MDLKKRFTIKQENVSNNQIIDLILKSQDLMSILKEQGIGEKQIHPIYFFRILYIYIKDGSELKSVKDQQIKTYLLAQFSSFKMMNYQLRSEFFNQLNAFVQHVYVTEGTQIIQKGQIQKKQYYICGGQVQLEGTETYLDEHNSFGLTKFIEQNQEYAQESIIATKNSYILSLHQDSFFRILKLQIQDDLRKQIHTLRQFSIFQKQPDYILKRLNSNLKYEKFRFKQQIINDYNSNNKIYFILEGSVKIQRTDKILEDNKLDTNKNKVSEKNHSCLSEFYAKKLLAKNFVTICTLNQGQFFGKLTDKTYKYEISVTCDSQKFICYSITYQQFKTAYINQNEQSYNKIASQIDRFLDEQTQSSLFFKKMKFTNQENQQMKKKPTSKQDVPETKFLLPFSKPLKNYRLEQLARQENQNKRQYIRDCNEPNYQNHLKQSSDQFQDLIDKSHDKTNMMFLLNKFHLIKNPEDDDQEDLEIIGLDTIDKQTDLKSQRSMKIRSSGKNLQIDINPQSLNISKDIQHRSQTARVQSARIIKPQSSRPKLFSGNQNRPLSGSQTPFQRYHSSKQCLFEIL